jgi:betaine-aldehyde dehydrogenase
MRSSAPVLVVLPFDGDDDGIALANDTPFGLAASAWTRGAIARSGLHERSLLGVCGLTITFRSSARCPTVGYKQSGYGKDMSAYSLDDYTNIKRVMTDITGVARKNGSAQSLAIAMSS